MKDIDEILEKYFEGETSCEEELLLREYFSQIQIPDKYKTYAPMFRYFTHERELLNKEDCIDDFIQQTKRKTYRQNVFVWTSIAAAIVLLIGLKFGLDHQSNTVIESYVYINGERSKDLKIINNKALISIENISESDDEILDSQIGILDSFIE